MFVACATRTMASAKPKLREAEPAVVVRTMDQIREERRQEAIAEARRSAAREREREARQGLFPPYRLIFSRVEDGYKRLGERKTVKAIIAEVAEKHGVTPGEILGPRRSRRLVAVRQEAIWEARVRRTDLSLPTLGRLFNRHHASILHATRRHERKLAETR